MIRIDASKCTGCRCCEAACAFHHTGSGGRLLSRIRVVNLYELGVDAPVVCQQCVERYCIACPEDALTLGPLGQVVGLADAVLRMRRLHEVVPDRRHRPRRRHRLGVRPVRRRAAMRGGVHAGRHRLRAGAGGTIALAPFKPGSERLAPSHKRALFVRALGLATRATWGVARG